MRRRGVRWAKTLLAGVLNGLGVVALLRYRHRKQAVILMYHGVTGEALPPTLNSEGLHVAVGRFSRQIAYLARHYRIISLRDLAEAVAQRRPLPERAVVLTFDDGYRNVYQHAWPVLQRYRAPATFLVVTSFVSSRTWLWLDRLEYAVHASAARAVTVRSGQGPVAYSLASPRAKRRSLVRLKRLLKALPEPQQRDRCREVLAQLGVETGFLDGYFCNPLSWEELAEMAASPLAGIGSHAVHHVNLDTLSEPQMRDELVQSKARLEERLGVPVEGIAYPAGASNEAVRRLARQAGYPCGLTTDRGLTGQGVDLFALRRNEVGNDDTPWMFAARVSGAFDALKRLAVFRR